MKWHRACLIVFLFTFLICNTSISNSQVPVPPDLLFGSFEMTSNGNGLIPVVVGFDITSPPTGHGAYSADWYRDVLQGGGSILGLPSGMQAANGWYFVVAGGPTITDFLTAANRWTRNGTNNDRIAGNSYEIRFTAAGGKAIMAFTTATLVDVPFELWYLADTPGDPSDDVRMVPWLFDDDFDDSFTFKLDHQASGANNDPYSDWIYLIMPADDSPGQAGYNQFVLDATNGTYAFDGQEHLARVILMNWNQHQNESASGAGDGPVNAMPETGTTLRLSFNDFLGVVVDIKPGSDPNSINCQKATGVIPVAILTTDTFDATQVNAATVTFGPAGAQEVHGTGHLEDVDGDGDQDMVFHFDHAETGISCNETEATLFGETFSGQLIFGSDSIRAFSPTPVCELNDPGEHDKNDVRLLVRNDARVAFPDPLGNNHGFFPADDCNSHIFVGGIWVGGITQRPPLPGPSPIVARGDFATEYVPSEIGATGTPYRVFNSSFPNDKKNWPPEFSDSKGKPIIVSGAQNLVVEYNDEAGFPFSGVPLGIEIRQRSLAYNGSQKKNALIFTWELTNISGHNIDDAFFGYFIDADIGSFADDRTSIVNDMAIAWDNDFLEPAFSEQPAIVGFDFLETPGNLGVANFIGITSGGPFQEPPFADDASQYDFLSGVVSSENNLIGDQRLFLSTGPFDLANGQSVIVAAGLLFGRAPDGTSSLATDPAFPFRPDPNDPVLADLLQIQSNVQQFYDQTLKGTGLPKSGEDLAATDSDAIPKAFALHQNYPNPFNPETEIRFELPKASHAVVRIFNTLGQEIRTLANKDYLAGYHTLRWNGKDNVGKDVASGVYVYRIKAGNFIDVKKMTLLR